jgi:hypothetical protein
MTDTSEKTQERKKPSWQEIQEKKISMAKERGARVLKVNSPLGSTMFNILRQFDMAYANFKARLGEMDGISHEEGEELIGRGQGDNHRLFRLYSQIEQADTFPLLYSPGNRRVHEGR